MNSINSSKNFNIIVLIGYMGSGKSSVGKKLAKKLDISFIDLDQAIEKKYNKTVSNIFSEIGEIEFRKIEKKILIKILDYKSNFVLSLGGGTPCYSNNMDVINSKTKNTFYLKVPIQKLSKRLYSRKDKRPIISHIKSVEEMNNFLAKHLFERYPFYEKSNFVIDSKRDDTIEVVNKIIYTLNNNSL
tara:strand:+ start:118 stop:678 length:561 start_codon:yes stop_codon:yes gene_type:complete